MGLVYKYLIINNVLCLTVQIVRRSSLAPPPPSVVTWDQYINAEPGDYCRLGREIVYKESSRSFKATVAMVLLILPGLFQAF